MCAVLHFFYTQEIQIRLSYKKLIRTSLISLSSDDAKAGWAGSSDGAPGKQTSSMQDHNDNGDDGHDGHDDDKDGHDHDEDGHDHDEDGHDDDDGNHDHVFDDDPNAKVTHMKEFVNVVVLSDHGQSKRSKQEQTK